MTSNIFVETKYLVDTTPAATLRKEWMNTIFFKKFCFFPEEIVYELRDNLALDQRMLVGQKIGITVDILDQLRNVMLNAEKIVDLYNNEGNGDVLLIATALSEQHKELGSMLRTQWIIVTEDKGVVKLANTFSIKTIDKRQFYILLEGQTKKEASTGGD